MAGTDYSGGTMKHRRIEGDCLEVMRDLPRGHFDLLLTDPPYAMPATYYQSQIVKRRWSDTSILTAWWRLVMERVSPLMKQDAQLSVFAGADAMAAFWPVLFEIARPLQIVVWDKQTMLAGRPFMSTTEFAIVGTIGNGCSRDRTEKRGKANIIRCERIPPTKRVHPAQKPREVLIELAEHLCPDGGRVLDPFAGAFSTEAACDSLGLECTSIEWGEAFAMPDDQRELFA